MSPAEIIKANAPAREKNLPTTQFSSLNKGYTNTAIKRAWEEAVGTNFISFWICHTFQEQRREAFFLYFVFARVVNKKS